MYNKITQQLRIHQWSKNILIFFPAIANQRLFNENNFQIILISAISFSLIASLMYCINDLFDLENDKNHPSKKNRPLASGDISIKGIYLIILLCGLTGFLLALYVGTKFTMVISVYIALNVLYSSLLKNIMILDVIILTFFYTIRLYAGNVLFETGLTEWMLSFSFFLFYSLGLLKRYTDFRNTKSELLPGRGYIAIDQVLIMVLGVSSGLISILVLILYVGNPEVKNLYKSPMLLIFIAPILLFWISRLWILSHRGLVTIDPVLFSINDKISYYVLFFASIIVLSSKFIII